MTTERAEDRFLEQNQLDNQLLPNLLAQEYQPPEDQIDGSNLEGELPASPADVGSSVESETGTPFVLDFPSLPLGANIQRGTSSAQSPLRNYSLHACHMLVLQDEGDDNRRPS